MKLGQWNATISVTVVSELNYVVFFYYKSASADCNILLWCFEYLSFGFQCSPTLPGVWPVTSAWKYEVPSTKGVNSCACSSQLCSLPIRRCWTQYTVILKRISKLPQFHKCELSLEYGMHSEAGLPYDGQYTYILAMLAVVMQVCHVHLMCLTRNRPS